MTYKLLKSVILAKTLSKNAIQQKLNIMYLGKQITDDQYLELCNLIIEVYGANALSIGDDTETE